jgi:hypothetical protein
MSSNNPQPVNDLGIRRVRIKFSETYGKDNPKIHTHSIITEENRGASAGSFDMAFIMTAFC